MRALLVCVGSRGDNEPFCALSQSLVSAGHEVDLFLQSDAMDLAPRHAKLKCHELPFTQKDFYKYVASPSHGQDHPNPRVKFVGIVADCIGELVLPCTKSVLEVAEANPPSIIFASSLARQLAMAVGEKLERPIAWVQLQPLTPTKHFPHYSQGEESIKAILAMDADEKPNEEDGEKYFRHYIDLERFLFEFLRERVQALYANLSLGTAPNFETDILPALVGDRETVLLVNAFSNYVIPKCSEHAASRNVLEPGALADAYIPSDWNPPEDLTSFLHSCKDDGEAPVCIGFGSMPFDRVQLLANAVAKLGRRAIFVGGGASPEPLDDSGKILRIVSAPYAWLLPQCSVMLSHGGAGVLHATLHAGIPAVIAPLMGDQFFHAMLVQRRGWGVQCSASLTTITEDEIVTSIESAAKCEDACRALGERMRADPGGPELLVQWLEDRLS